jgi:hypothetical protein
MKRIVAIVLLLLTSPVWAVTTVTTGSIGITQSSTGNDAIVECTAVNVSTKPLDVLLVLYSHDGTTLKTGAATLGPQQETAILSSEVSDDLHCSVIFSGSAKSVRGAIVAIDNTNFKPLSALPAQ